MKKPFLILAACSVLIGCTSELADSVADGDLLHAQSFSENASISLQAIEASPLHSSSNKSLPKNVSDEVRRCDKKAYRDGRGRQTGSVWGGASCPFRATWMIHEESEDLSRIKLDYRLYAEKFGDVLPVSVLTIAGERTSQPFGGQFLHRVRYQGRLVTVDNDTTQFTVESEEYSTMPRNVFEIEVSESAQFLPNSMYRISVSTQNRNVEGIIRDGVHYSINGIEVTRQDFEKTFILFR